MLINSRTPEKRQLNVGGLSILYKREQKNCARLGKAKCMPKTCVQYLKTGVKCRKQKTRRHYP